MTAVCSICIHDHIHHHIHNRNHHHFHNSVLLIIRYQFVTKLLPIVEKAYHDHESLYLFLVRVYEGYGIDMLAGLLNMNLYDYC